MLKHEIEVRKMIHQNLNLQDDINALSLDADLKSIGMDSINFVKLVVEIESEYDIDFPEEKLLITEADTIEKICDIIETCVAESRS